MNQQVPASDANQLIHKTNLGHFRISWEDRGLTALKLIEPPSEQPTKKSSTKQKVPTWISGLCTQLTAHFEGKPQDFSKVPLVMEHLSPFEAEIYRSARDVGAGETISYAELARWAKRPQAARAVGNALRKNPWILIVPCHRVLASSGDIGGFSAYGALQTKAAMLGIEGAAGYISPTATFYDSSAKFYVEPVNAVNFLRDRDPRLKKLIERVGEFRPTKREANSPYDYLASAIIYQQISGAAASTIMGRVKALHDGKNFPPAAKLLRLKENTLRQAGVSANKQASLRDLAQRQDRGEIPTWEGLRCQTNDQIIDELTQVRGIGRWTVEMLLMFGLGRPDVMPVSDLGIRKGYSILHGYKSMIAEKELARRTLNWQPYRTVAAWYLWRAVDQKS